MILEEGGRVIEFPSRVIFWILCFGWRDVRWVYPGMVWYGSSIFCIWRQYCSLGGVGFTLADGVVDISQILLDMQVARAGGNRPGTGFGICIDGHGSWS